VGEERTCPIQYGTKLFKYPLCGAKIKRREPVLSRDEIIGQIPGPGPKSVQKARALDEVVPDYIYECEDGHAYTRPEWWADVPTVPPGTITLTGFSGKSAIVNKPPLWYTELSEEEKKKFLK